ncbi:type II toxin-antitoxin system VapC family toxin [Phyllobacterium sp. UNC302MFCol5.2]|uniref:type II toxin-antitoxin system VapC family toxin n=1 Tax=Phyllobacterium sp. UNC302MFCol5.2 TaxID=1449065 RepID=UPI0004819BC8|nr:type II toxin-antitoxin system VapC family toxin [Phyllobacterium sp. UNC302MFCol5.2]
MARFVIGPDVALHLAEIGAAVPAKHKLLAPTLLRSQVLALLYKAVRRGDINRNAANAKLDYLRALKLRLLGDRVLQRVAWDIAQQLDWPDTYQAEYLALTRLQADAFITLDCDLAQTAQAIIPVASIEDLITEPD